MSAFKHGTTTGYFVHGCRCSQCRDARNQLRRTKQAAGLRDDDDPRHGTVTGYKDYGCRCEECQQAYSEWQGANRVKSLDTDAPTPEQLRIYGQSLGLPIGARGKIPPGLVVRWNRAHPDRPYVG